MPITNFSKPNLKPMVTMNGILSCGLWLLQAHVLVNCSHIKAEHIKVGYLDLYSKGGKIRRLYIPKNLRTEADKMVEESRPDIWLYLPEPFRAAHYYSWNCFPTQAFCRKIRNEQGSSLSSFIPSSFC